MPPDLEREEKEIIKFNQRIAFAEERDALKNGRYVKESSVLAKLDPIHAQGCLGRAALSKNSKHQIIIPKNSDLAHLIFYCFHKKKSSFW